MEKNITLMKFGGTSVGSPENIKRVIDLVSRSSDKPIGIVVSAFTGITDQLISMAYSAQQNKKDYRKDFRKLSARHFAVVRWLIKNPQKQQEAAKKVEQMLQELESMLIGIWLIKEVTPKTLDCIMSFGERLSAYIISESFCNFGINTEYLDARKVVKTDNSFTYAKVDFKQTNKFIKNYFKKSQQSIKIITGFIGSTKSNETTTLGRGGSDYSASIFGVALGVNTIEIWTDVNGFMTADPRKIPSAFSIRKMSYLEAMEMSHFGAKVIYPPTMIPAMQKNISLLIKNTFHPDHPGTIIEKQASSGFSITGITSTPNISILLLEGVGMVGAPGFAMRLFNVLGKNNINIILITQASSEHTICFAINLHDVQIAKKAIDEEFLYEIKEKRIEPVSIKNYLSIIAIVGENMKQKPGIAGKIFFALGNHKINIVAIAQGSSELNISIVIAKKDEIKALQAIHDIFFKHVNLPYEKN